MSVIGRVSEMEGIIGDLEEELSQRRDEAAEAISQWESHCGEVEERAEALERELQAVSKEKDEVKLSALSMEQSIVSRLVRKFVFGNISADSHSLSVLLYFKRIRLESSWRKSGQFD